MAITMVVDGTVSGWGSETSTDGWSSWGSSSTSDWGDWGSSSTSGWGDWGSEGSTEGWVGWESSTTSTDGWGDWGDYEETTIDWFNNDTFWEDTTMPNWNYEDYNTTDIAAGDLEYQPSFEELDYMKKLLKENSKGIKAMMSKFSREEQYRIMQSMKSKTPVKQSVTISELRRMNASSIMRTFKTLNITFMKQFMKEYEQE